MNAEVVKTESVTIRVGSLCNTFFSLSQKINFNLKSIKFFFKTYWETGNIVFFTFNL